MKLIVYPPSDIITTDAHDSDCDEPAGKELLNAQAPENASLTAIISAPARYVNSAEAETPKYLRQNT
jgi:hypothetical protein